MTLDRVAILLTGSCAFFTFPGDCPARLVAGRNGDSVARTGWFQHTFDSRREPRKVNALHNEIGTTSRFQSLLDAVDTRSVKLTGHPQLRPIP
jgi:hypothetical protein